MSEIKKSKKIIATISIGSALVGSLGGSVLKDYLTPEQIKEIKVTETKMEIPEDYYKVLTEGIANKYELSQIKKDKKMIPQSQEISILINGWNKKIKETGGIQLQKKVDVEQFNNHLRYGGKK